MNLRVGLASIGFATCLLGCGLRTDPDYSPVCVDNTVAGETGETGGEPLAPRIGSCQDPIDLPTGQNIVVRGSLGGCSGTEGWCGGSGAEDVYRIGSVVGDVFVDFRPEETNFNPVLRVVRGEDPCLEGVIEESEVCADIVNSVPGRGFYDQGGDDTYYIIVDTELGESGDYAFDLRFGDNAFEGDCLDAVEDQAIELMAGGNFVWEATLDAKQGRLDSSCSAPGDEDIFTLVLTGGGTVTASVEVLEGDIQPIVSLRDDCATASELSCGGLASANFGGSATTYLVVDQIGANKGRYRLTVDFF
ncbi:hypothetical protein ENSA5_35720 [Enhygromyxa salina]|uniref:Uncharacterized protein n=1 Tax=Enhygromyxa salina TaxID=215803 RepID=A0A2S9XUF7_9BACT|nr:hypothetical protein [Enhygromyxa salina]PRP96496.1 hypothetical protein ENSA5_35720 [Enhygromyxa salina]